MQVGVNMFRKQSLFLLILFLLLAACTAAAELAANPVAVERPTQTSTVVAATETPLPTLTPAGVTLFVPKITIYYNSDEGYWLVDKAIELVNLPYSAETPLDATYTHTNPDFTFDYPDG
jgi:hypothetical protein